LKHKISFIFYWSVKLKWKINWTKVQKKSKEWGSKSKIKIKFWLEGEIEKNNHFNKRPKRYQKNENQIG